MVRSIFKLLLLYFCIFEITCQNPEVEIPQGRLRGDIRTNLDGGTYYSFQNIPYGKPPVGELRFKAPQPAASWEGIRDATQDLTECIQQMNMGGQEDCLYLNVYTPNLSDNDTQLPVMVWIHGGAFISGSAKETVYGAQFLLTKDVVLVAINYRLGIFGFLSLDDPELDVTGNAGMKDQVLALEWVRDNIQYFGGDPNNVLIFGESAGSTSVHLLLLSPMANGLFHKAISQSGDALTDLSVPITRNNGEAIAEVLGIETENWEEMLKSLQAEQSSNLALAESRLNTGLYQFFSTPTIEISSNGSTFLDRRPIDIIRSGTYNKVPFIIGVNDAEELLFQYLSRQATGESILIEDFTNFIPKEFNIEGTPSENSLSLRIKDFYYEDTEPSRDDISQAVALTSDWAFIFPCYKTAMEYIRSSENAIYFYYFTAITDLSYFRRIDNTISTFPGAAHADELGYLFYMLDTPSINTGSIEERLLRSMVEFWTNFAIYGNPTPDTMGDLTWEPITKNQFNYLHIGTEDISLVLNSVFTPERIEFWWSLFEEYL